MKSTLQKLWNGDIELWSEKWDRSNEAEQLVELLERHKNALAEQLDKRGRTILEEYENCYEELENIGHEDAFIKGFSLATKIMFETLMKQ